MTQKDEYKKDFVVEVVYSVVQVFSFSFCCKRQIRSLEHFVSQVNK